MYSPDGHTIVFDRLVEPYLFVKWEWMQDGAHERRLARGFAPVWSPLVGRRQALLYANEKLMVMAAQRRPKAGGRTGDRRRHRPYSRAPPTGARLEPAPASNTKRCSSASRSTAATTVTEPTTLARNISAFAEGPGFNDKESITADPTNCEQRLRRLGTEAASRATRPA